jgi:hypothetical protein
MNEESAGIIEGLWQQNFQVLSQSMLLQALSVNQVRITQYSMVSKKHGP